MRTTDFLIVAVVLVAYGVVSGKLNKTVVTAPMVFVLVGFAVGPDGFSWVNVGLTDEVVLSIMEIALVLVLFTDATRIDIGLLRERFRLPVRLLAIGMPLVMVAGTVVALLLFPTFSVWEALVLAVVLAPTDAALGQIVVSSKAVPAVVRQALNIESGLNDGLALPVLTFALAFSAAAAGAEAEGVGHWLQFALSQVAVAVIIGVAIGYIGGRVVSWATTERWMSPAFQRLSALGLALLAFTLTQELSGSGFIAAFVAGLTLGAVERPLCECLFDFAEAEGQLLLLLTFLFFGAAAVAPAIRASTWETWLYAGLSLTVVRLVPVLIAIADLQLRFFTRLFIGWFGPRGIASILFGILVLESMDFGLQDDVFHIVTITVLASIFIHGLSAKPAADWYSSNMAEMSQEVDDMAEFGYAPDMPTRIEMPD